MLLALLRLEAEAAEDARPCVHAVKPASAPHSGDGVVNESGAVPRALVPLGAHVSEAGARFGVNLRDACSEARAVVARGESKAPLPVPEHVAAVRGARLLRSGVHARGSAGTVVACWVGGAGGLRGNVAAVRWARLLRCGVHARSGAGAVVARSIRKARYLVTGHIAAVRRARFSRRGINAYAVCRAVVAREHRRAATGISCPVAAHGCRWSHGAAGRGAGALGAGRCDVWGATRADTCRCKVRVNVVKICGSTAVAEGAGCVGRAWSKILRHPESVKAGLQHTLCQIAVPAASGTCAVKAREALPHVGHTAESAIEADAPVAVEHAARVCVRGALCRQRRV